MRNQKTNLIKEDVNALTNFTRYIMNAEDGGLANQPIVSVETFLSLPPTKPSSNITNKDVHEMIPQKYAIGSKAPSVDELKRLLVLQADPRSATYIKKCPRIISEPV